VDNLDRSKTIVGNDFLLPKKPVAKIIAPRHSYITAAAEMPVAPAIALSLDSPSVQRQLEQSASRIKLRFGHSDVKENILDSLHNNSLAVYALLILAICLAAQPLAFQFLTRNIKISPSNSPKISQNMAGLNTSVNSVSLSATENGIASQTATLNLGSKIVPISPSLIKSWLEVSPSINGSQDDIHLNSALMTSSLASLVNSYINAPVNQVTVTRSDGSSEIAIAGQDGTGLSSSADISGQVIQISKDLFSNKGFQINAPLVSMPFQSLTAASFDKLIVTDLTSKQMYVYQNGQIVQNYAVSAGKPTTPTPVGEFHIWTQLKVQTMTGPGYVQPNVPWISYFDHSGDAIHGVYWRPASVFGNVNTSHGCIGLPVAEAEWVYNWANVGTTVITTLN
jgi:hypothetical protein